MKGGDRQEPLWASSLADQRRPHDDVIVRVLEEEDEEDVGAGSGGDRPPRRRPPRVVVIAGVVAVVAVALSLADGQAWTVDDVPSYWGRVPMTCETVRVEEGERAGEWFSCRAVGGGRLPPGLYVSPESQWRSDITGRPARKSRIRISRDGDVEGWAAY